MIMRNTFWRFPQHFGKLCFGLWSLRLSLISSQTKFWYVKINIPMVLETTSYGGGLCKNSFREKNKRDIYITSHARSSKQNFMCSFGMRFNKLRTDEHKCALALVVPWPNPCIWNCVHQCQGDTFALWFASYSVYVASFSLSKGWIDITLPWIPWPLPTKLDTEN